MQVTLTGENMQWMKELDQHYNLRYPPQHSPIETGSDDWDRTEDLFSELCSFMPVSLEQQIQTLESGEKGRRILMRKPKSMVK
jgi:hypothetical protein